jgi:predicted ATPase/DNA-binding CsgD family transcriptional regulator
MSLVTQMARVSEREAEVLAALGEHLSNAQIASRLTLSVRTVETHVSSLLRKLGVADRHELAALAPTLAGSSSSTSADTGQLRGLPPTWTPFIGRVREQAEVIEAFNASRLVTLLGPGGAGKTRLAGQVASHLAEALPLGATFVGLVSTRPGFFLQTVASVLGVTERPGEPLREAVFTRLRPGRSLLVLDNCEHLVDETAAFLTALLGQSPDLLVLTTSRTRIAVAGERVVPLSGLSLVADETGGAAGSEAVALFVDRARALNPQFEADTAAIAELCAALDGMPLAIELATARSAALGVAGLRVGLADRLRLLSGGRSSDERHRSLRAVLDWSYELLDDEERAGLRRLSRFAGDFDVGAASAVIGLSPAVVADVVGRLADKSLLAHRPGAGRWSMLETVRAYALDKLEGAGETARVTDRYVRWAADTAAAVEENLVLGHTWRNAFDETVADLRAALVLAGDDTASRLARSLGHLTFARRFLAESRGHYVRAANCAADDVQAVQDLRCAAGVALVEKRGQLLYDYAVAAASRAEAAEDRALQAAVLGEAVSVASRFPALFDRDVGLAELQRMLDVAQRVAPADDKSAQAELLAARAWTASRTSEIPGTAEFEAALDAARQADDPVLISAALDALGAANVMEGRFSEAHRMSVRRLDLLNRLPDHSPRAGAEILDILHMATENAVTAGELSFALETAHQFDDDKLVAAAPHMAWSKPVVPLVLLGRFAEAIEYGLRARDAWTDVGRPAARWLAPSMYSLVLCHELRGDGAAASDWREFAIEEIAGEQTRNVHFQVGGMVTFVEARLALHFGRWDDAARLVAHLPVDDDAWWQLRHWYFDAYPWAVAAEMAVAAGLSDAPRRLAAAQPAGGENRWAAACLARAKARLTGDAEDLETALTAWEQLGARYERACTLALMPKRRAEAESELRALGVRTLAAAASNR